MDSKHDGTQDEAGPSGLMGQPEGRDRVVWHTLSDRVRHSPGLLPESDEEPLSLFPPRFMCSPFVFPSSAGEVAQRRNSRSFQAHSCLLHLFFVPHILLDARSR